MKKTVLFLLAMLLMVGANAQVAFSENFDNVTTSGGVGDVPSTWTLYADSQTNYNSSPYNVMGNSWKVIYFNGMSKMAFSCSYTNEAQQCDRWMVSPQINIPSAGYFLLFDLWGANANYPESLKVMVSTSGTEKTDFTQTVVNVPRVASGTTTQIADLSQFAGQDIHLAFINCGTDGVYMGVDNITVQMLPESAISLEGVSVVRNVSNAAPFNFDVTVRNMGSTPLTSFNIEYSFNNGTSQTETVNGINVSPMGYYTKTLSGSIPTVGDATISVVVSQPNGQTDPDLSDNSGSASTVVYDNSMVVQRTMLLEHFTTQVCQYCPQGDERLEYAYEKVEHNVAWVAHHAGYYTDDFTINETNNEYIKLYNTNETWAPAFCIDRDFSFAGDEVGPVLSVRDTATLRRLFLEEVATPAYVSVNIGDISWNADIRRLGFTVSGTFLKDFTDDIRLTVFITEDSIIATQTSTNGQIPNFQHNHVLRKVCSQVWGDQLEVPTTAGNSYSKNYYFTNMPATWNENKVRIVAFLSKYNPNAVTDVPVANARKSRYITTSPEGIRTAQQPTISVRTYPNPATRMAIVEAESSIHSYTVVNSLGQQVMHASGLNVSAIEMNVEDLPQGIYFISVQTDNGLGTERLSVVK